MLALTCGREPRLIGDHPPPERRRGEARLGLRLAGVCDTDLQLARGYMGFQGVLGHEFVADVVEADDATWVGRRVVADINAGCGACRECVENAGHHCARRTVLGILGRDGALAEEFVVPERCLVAVPDSVPDDCAVFAEPLAAAAHVLDELGSAEPAAIVLGDGKLGQLIARALVAAGVKVTLVGHHTEKLALAAAAGATTRLEAEIERETQVTDLVVEATGSASGLARALALVRPRGKVVLKTTVAGRLEVDFAPVVIHEVSIVGSRCGNMKRAIELLCHGAVDPRPLIAARYPLARADQALQHAARPGTLKVLVEGTPR
jgi:2-desacetyl-2-hydroxyethyl bacteriochlorophyllide A dehydrogenase